MLVYSCTHMATAGRHGPTNARQFIISQSWCVVEETVSVIIEAVLTGGSRWS